MHQVCQQKAVLKMGLFDGLSKSGDRGKSSSQKALQGYQVKVDKINAMEETVEALSDQQLLAKTAVFRDQIAAGASPDSLLEEAFAVVREAAWRVLGLRHYDVQLLGGIALYEGKLAEMATGEGKTLVATLPAYLNALSGKGSVFVVTPNDYLARRDAETMGQVHRFLGLSVGLVQSGMKEQERQQAYGSDVTYLTNQELGFDYLRDHLSVAPSGVVQVKPFHFCLVDEADSILIDEARTPLIISKATPAPQGKFVNSAKIATALQKNLHYKVTEKDQSVAMTEKGFRAVEQVLGKGMFEPSDPWAPYIINALKAKELFNKDKEYIVRDKDIVIVDTFSGRVLEGRKYSDGLHQSIEAKEGIAVSSQSQIIAQVTYQSLFRNFERLCGMTGTAMTDVEEFVETYGLEVVQVPTALPVARRDYPDVVFRTRDAGLKAMLSEAERVHKDGRPILIGTTSVDMSERVARELGERGVQCQVLNAKPDSVDRESEIVTQAGRLGVVTVATNMAGRGTDILLGGNPSTMARVYVRGALAASLLQKDQQAALPTVGEAFYPVALSKAALALVKKAEEVGVEVKGQHSLSRAALEELVAVASEVSPTEDKAVQAARQALSAVKEEFAQALKDEKAKVVDMGGLYVLGTARHESRRVDNQLRGRAGRQGDPGATRFFLSLDDDIFRIFGGDRMKKLLESFRLSEDMPLESKSVSETLDKVQKATEDYFTGIRRAVFKYDEVLNEQRSSLYRTREQVLGRKDVDQMLINYATKTVDEILPGYVKGGKTDAAGLAKKVLQFFPSATPADVDKRKMQAMNEASLRSAMYKAAEGALRNKMTEIEAVRPGLAAEVGRYLALTQIDNLWSEHLQKMNLVKESTGYMTYAGKDPMDEYQLAARELYKDLLGSVRRNTIYSLGIYSPRAQKQQQPQAA